MEFIKKNFQIDYFLKIVNSSLIVLQSNYLKMVNTFLIGTFEYTASSLDIQRLFKQAVEAKQIIITIQEKLDKPDTKRGYRNHPAVIMWTPFISALKLYYNTILRRVYLHPKFRISRLTLYQIDEDNIEMPWFMSFEPLIYSHRARLYQKNPNYYSFLEFPDEYLDIGYIWIKHPKEYYLNEINVYSYDNLMSIATPLAKRYIELKYCNAICKNGKKCNHMLKFNKKSDYNQIYCGIHRNFKNEIDYNI